LPASFSQSSLVKYLWIIFSFSAIRNFKVILRWSLQRSSRLYGWWTATNPILLLDTDGFIGISVHRNPSSWLSSHFPKNNLPIYDGSLDKWDSFRDRFKSMIIDDSNLKNVDRMHYLSSCFTEETSNALSKLAVTNSNFLIAWDMLINRYQNKRRLITVYLWLLFDLSSFTTKTSNGFRTLRDQINSATQALRNVDRTIQHWDDVLVSLVAEKLDPKTRRAWEFKLGNTKEYPHYSELDQFFESRLSLLNAMIPAFCFKGEVQDDVKKKSFCFTYCVNHSVNISTLQNEPSLIPVFCVLEANIIPTFRFY